MSKQISDATFFKDDFRDLGKTHIFGGLLQRKDFPRIPVRPDVRINSKDPRDYMFEEKPVGYGWFPTIIRLQNGNLLCGYREGAAHVYSPDGRSIVSISYDSGRNWSKSKVVYDPKDYTSGVRGMGQAGDGRIWLAVQTQHYEKSVGAANDPRAWKSYQVVLCSEDNGETWKERWRSIPGQESSQMDLRTPIQLSNGELMWVASCADERGEPIRATCIQKEIDGRLEFEVRPHPELGPTSDEPTMVETKHPGVLIAMMRQQQHGRYYATAKSCDYGKTWTQWRLSNVYLGCTPTRPWLRKMQDGTLIFCYGQRWIGRTFVVPSHDDGETWDIAHRQVHLHSPTEYHNMWDSHYTDIARAEGKMWFVVDYIASPKHTHQKGLYGTYINTKYFKDVYKGLILDSRGTAVNPDTKGFWSFDELKGNFVRDSVSANYGEINNAKRVKGCIGNAMSFNGKNSHVMIYDDASLWVPKYFTLEAWINTRDSLKDQTIISKAPRYTFCLKGGKLCLEIGEGEMVAEMKSSLPKNRWVHVAVSYSMRHMYSRATFYIDGKEDSWVSPAYGHKHNLKRYADALALTDMQIASGVMFQEGFARKNTSTDNIVIGMDNDLNGRAFYGLIDEVAIHANDLKPGQIAQSTARCYLSSGEVSSRLIARPENSNWKKFHASITSPEGTKITFRIEDKKGNVLKKSVSDGEDISDIADKQITLRAELSSSRPGQTPILHEWSVSSDGESPVRIVSVPLPDQSAEESVERDDGESKNNVLL